jgi:hypothetical protein
MCVNDLVCQGAEPLFFLDYFATGRLEVAWPRGSSRASRRAAPRRARARGRRDGRDAGMYEAGDFDLAGFAVGAMERGTALPDGVAEGDVLLGLASDGVHSNGYSLVRRIVERSGLGWDAPAPFARRRWARRSSRPRGSTCERARRGAGGWGPCARPHHRGRADREPAARPARRGWARDRPWRLGPAGRLPLAPGRGRGGRGRDAEDLQLRDRHGGRRRGRPGRSAGCAPADGGRDGPCPGYRDRGAGGAYRGALA